jgi:hypothetical protein
MQGGVMDKIAKILKHILMIYCADMAMKTSRSSNKIIEYQTLEKAIENAIIFLKKDMEEE